LGRGRDRPCRAAETSEDPRRLAEVARRLAARGRGDLAGAELVDQLAHPVRRHAVMVREVDLDDGRGVARAEAFLLVHREDAVVRLLATVRGPPGGGGA